MTFKEAKKKFKTARKSDRLEESLHQFFVELFESHPEIIPQFFKFVFKKYGKPNISTKKAIIKTVIIQILLQPEFSNALITNLDKLKINR